ncbi:hypothetical protein MUK70_25335 [Dyadobacter chenwenxiniae]|uniref:DUF6985 domain-containing protein n=1 Tax=Dyadobacter chenwenxiniae TaxID=2906456 RepID=A0A9X1PQ56_9BACT|nr:hypothetical protein [Dyadobacter chenwenxiniae]MCF0064445.1 hypothetical protein [Dyadobacter chenwenxiniae]UON82352.1 hypothetical protein MUK70_25335 [Dyadobacter chenwenxiniae]
MERVIKSTVIGEWKSKFYPFDCWESIPIEIPFLNNQAMRISLRASNPDEAAKLAAETDPILNAFLEKTILDRNALSALVYGHCTNIFEITGFDHECITMFKQVQNPESWILNAIALEELLDLAHINDVWKFVRANGIYISRGKEGEIYLQISFKCDWDEEHGLDLVFKDGIEFVGMDSLI